MWNAGLRAALVIAACAGAHVFCMAQDLVVLSVSQAVAGEVVTRIGMDPAAHPKPADFLLQLDPTTSVSAAALVAESTGPKSALLICIDRSGSMGLQALTAMRSALASTLVPGPGKTQLPANVAIVAFGSQAVHLLPLTDDASRVAQALPRLTIEREREGKTRLFDAVAGGLAELRGFDAASKRLLVVSDGNDEGSQLSQKALMAAIESSSPRIQVDAIGFGALAAEQSGSLATLAGATGGRFAVVTSHDAQSLAAALGKMVQQTVGQARYELRFKYVPVAGGRTSESAQLIFKPDQGNAMAQPLAFAVAAAEVPAPAADASSTTKTPSTSAEAGGRSVDGGTAFSISGALLSARTYLVALPPLAWVAIALLLLALLALVAYAVVRRRRDSMTTPETTDATGVQPSPSSSYPGSSSTTIVRQPLADTLREPLSPTVAPISSAAKAEPRDRRTIIAHRWPAPGQGVAVAALQCIAGADQGSSFTVTEGSVRIGAAPDNDYIISGDDFVSSHHLTIKVESGGLYAVDMQSSNGTALNGSRFKGSTRLLAPGDHLTLGNTTIRVSTAQAAERPAGARYEPRVG